MHNLFQSGSTRAFNRRLEASRPRLYRIAYAWCHNTLLADDLVQETHVRALRHRHQLRELERMDAWLFRILANLWRDHIRQRRPFEDIDNCTITDDCTPEIVGLRQEVVGRVRGEVRALPDSQRQVLMLVDIEEFSYRDAAEILDIPIGTVMSRLCRARGALRERLVRKDKQNERLKIVK